MNPYRDIWLTPRRAFLPLYESRQHQPLFVTPIVVSGVVMGLNMMADFTDLPLHGVVVAAMVMAIPISIGLAFLATGLVMPGCVKIAGSIWSGQATMRQLVNVFSISSLPFCVLLAAQIITMSMGRNPDLDETSVGLRYIVSLWSFSLLIIGIATVQRFRFGVALMSLVIAYLPFLLIALLIITSR
jgi:hypothetical protein